MELVSRIPLRMRTKEESIGILLINTWNIGTCKPCFSQRLTKKIKLIVVVRCDTKFLFFNQRFKFNFLK